MNPIAKSQAARQAIIKKALWANIATKKSPTVAPSRRARLRQTVIPVCSRTMRGIVIKTQ